VICHRERRVNAVIHGATLAAAMRKCKAVPPHDDC
jgi:hypothetical protein